MTGKQATIIVDFEDVQLVLKAMKNDANVCLMSDILAVLSS